MMGHCDKLKGGDEWDCFTGGRKALKWLGLHRNAAKIKKRFRRRIRREEKRKMGNERWAG